ncbi:MAG: hypothetical protein ABI605_20745 [Rhizobacter sp.]
MSRDTVTKKSRPAKKVSAPPPAAVKPEGWFDRLKRLRFRFKRQGVNIHVLLEDPAEHIADIKRQSAEADTSEAALLRAALKGVLDKHPSTRLVLVHLSVLEKALGRHGLKALEQLPPDVMRKAVAQLETLVSNWSNAHLAALRAKLVAAVMKRQRAGDRRSTAERLSDFADSNRLQVNEASVTTFLEVNAQWERSLTGQKLDTPDKQK